MLKRTLLPTTAACSVLLALMVTSRPAAAADPAAGKALAQQQQCADCHAPADWQGNTEAQLQGKIKDVMDGKIPHKKKFSLSAEQIANIAAYWASGAP